jgi:hypothetical protein
MLNRGIHTDKGYYKYSWSEILLVIAVFTKELGSRNIFGIDYDFLGYTFFILYFIIYFSKIISYNATPTGLLIYFVFSSLLSIAILNLQFDGFVKQIIPIAVILAVTFTVLKHRDINLVFLLYVKVTFWTAIFGLIQVALSYGGIDILIKQSRRLDSIAYEPSHYAAILMPALVYTYLNIKKYKTYFFVMLAALFFTFNLTAYLVFIGIFTFATFHPLYILVTVPIGYYLLFNVLPYFSQNFNLRFFDTYSTVTGEKNILTSDLNVNSTTLSFYSNFEVAKYSLSKNLLLGSGLGGHEQMYARYFEGSTFSTNILYGINSKSAHSLSIRILSELGLVGTFLYIYVLVKNFIFSSKGMHYAISLSCISHFLCKSLKLGAYIDYGTPFFFAVLILNARAYLKTKYQAGPSERRHYLIPIH